MQGNAVGNISRKISGEWRIHLGGGLFVVFVALVAINLLRTPDPVVTYYDGSSSSSSTQVKQSPSKTTLPVSSNRNASKLLATMRVNQADPNEYSDNYSHDVWWESACSAASMAAILRAYGWQFTVADVLEVEEGQLHGITTQLGMLNDDVFNQTMNRFGFDVQNMTGASLNDVINKANSGNPVEVSFPPQKYPGGHLLIVRGGDGNNVYLTDSSKLNRREMSRAEFLSYWGGYARVATPRKYTVLGSPTISLATLQKNLDAYDSPAKEHAKDIYDAVVKYGVDPAYMLATFLHESTMGTKGEARATKSIGNLRCIPNVRCIDQDRGGYAAYDSYQQAAESWAQLIVSNVYARSNPPLVETRTIIPRYAPQADNNDENAYIASLNYCMDTARAGKVC